MMVFPVTTNDVSTGSYDDKARWRSGGVHLRVLTKICIFAVMCECDEDVLSDDYVVVDDLRLV